MTMRHNDAADADTQEPIKDQNWFIVDPGADVYGSDGEKIGTVRERMPHYLEIKVRENFFSDAEMYVPRDLIDRVEGDKVYLTRSESELKEMDLKTPPAVG